MRVRLTTKVEDKDWSHIVLKGISEGLTRDWIHTVKVHHPMTRRPAQSTVSQFALDALRYPSGSFTIRDQFGDSFEITKDTLEQAINSFIKLIIRNERSLFYAHGGELRFEVSHLTDADCNAILQLACYGDVVH